MSYSAVDSVAKILNLDKYNGRVNISEPTDPSAKFKMFEKIAAKNKSNNYYDSLVGNLEWNILAHVYFSAENIQIIQNGLRAGVFDMSKGKFNVPPQNLDSLKVIMRSIYLQFAEHRPDNIKQQVAKMNSLVLDYAIPSVYNEAVAYVKYTQDQSTLVVPMDHPLNHDRAYKQLELKPWV